MFPVFEDQVRTVQPRPAVRGVPAECVRALLLPGERHAPADPRPRPQPRPRQAVLICHDCKEMVLQIIRPGEVAKNQARRLMLAQFARQSSEVRNIRFSGYGGCEVRC